MTFRAVQDVGEAARRLLPRLAEMLGDDEANIPVRKARVAAAKMYWRLTGDKSAVLPTVAAVLRAGDIPAVEAAELAGELADDSLVPLLRNLLADEWATVAAAQAIWRITGHAEVEPVLRVLVHGWPWPSKAVTVLVEMRATGAVDALRELAERNERVGRPALRTRSSGKTRHSAPSSATPSPRCVREPGPQQATSAR